VPASVREMGTRLRRSRSNSTALPGLARKPIVTMNCFFWAVDEVSGIAVPLLEVNIEDISNLKRGVNEGHIRGFRVWLGVE
jgi:hypothetical protein